MRRILVIFFLSGYLSSNAQVEISLNAGINNAQLFSANGKKEEANHQWPWQPGDQLSLPVRPEQQRTQ